MIAKDPNQTYISASEINDFIYCKRGWWLNQNNLNQSNNELLNSGNIKHQELYRDVTAFEKFKNKIILTVIFFIIVYIVFAIFLL